ncbi:MAG: YggS family pyridoxal phosphate-dependent enzyme [Cycloclasticus sp.]
MPSLLQRYFAQQDVINVIQQQASASPVKLLAVSKTRPADDVARLYKAGQRDFGENYLQDALEKQRALAHLDIAWHFIGPIQSNKTRDIARYFSWVHSVDRLKVARRLSEQRPIGMSPLDICLQVNVDEEETKAGLMLHELRDKIEPILALKNIRLRGLMAIPKAGKTVAEQRQSFKKVADALAEINQQFDLALDTLSMGMSGDLEAAIAEGATMVRVGTAIFGVRATKSKV